MLRPRVVSFWRALNRVNPPRPAYATHSRRTNVNHDVLPSAATCATWASRLAGLGDRRRGERRGRRCPRPWGRVAVCSSPEGHEQHADETDDGGGDADTVADPWVHGWLLPGAASTRWLRAGCTPLTHHPLEVVPHDTPRRRGPLPTLQPHRLEPASRRRGPVPPSRSSTTGGLGGPAVRGFREPVRADCAARPAGRKMAKQSAGEHGHLAARSSPRPWRTAVGRGPVATPALRTTGIVRSTRCCARAPP